jgi:putative SOS response-associated peptidase YedK
VRALHNTAGVAELNERFRVPIAPGAGVERFNIAPTEEVLAIVAPDGEPDARRLRWGLVPWWSKDLKGAARMDQRACRDGGLDAGVSGSAAGCVVSGVADRCGYFEWLKPEKRNEPRQPFFFQVDGGVLFAFAALWTTARVVGEQVQSVTLLTCDATSNSVAAGIHDRMPVILADREVQNA